MLSTMRNLRKPNYENEEEFEDTELTIMNIGNRRVTMELEPENETEEEEDSNNGILKFPMLRNIVNNKKGIYNRMFKK